jgi:hypothetical protein
MYVCFEIPDKTKLAVRRGRKATGFLKGEEKIAGLHGEGSSVFLLVHKSDEYLVAVNNTLEPHNILLHVDY